MENHLHFQPGHGNLRVSNYRELVFNLTRRSLHIFKNIIKHAVDKEYLQWRLNYSKRLLKFKDIHKGEGCFIIGNGPSLNKMDLTPLKNYHTFGLNKIYLMFDKVDLNLSYHVAVNPLVIEHSIREIESLPCPTFLSYKAAHKVIKPLNHLYYIFPEGAYMFQPDLLRHIYEGFTVTYVAIQIAYYMGFSQVFLIGVDHNFKFQGIPNEKQLLHGNDLNHFDPRYFGNKEWHLPDLEGSESSYHIAQSFFYRNGRKIYDATVEGKLQIFPKISYELALKMCSRK